MPTEETYSNLPWMTDEMKAHMRYMDQLVKDKNIEALFQLNDNGDFSIALYNLLSQECDYHPDRLNDTKRVLFICMLLENAGQADHILSFLQEGFPQHAPEAAHALQEIGAMRSAEIIKQAVALLPKDGKWFLQHADESSQLVMAKLDHEFSGYPDGMLRDLYRKYADAHQSDF